MATTDAPRTEVTPQRWLVRVGWLLGFWLAGVATMGVAAWLLRWVMRAVGLA